MGAVAIIPARYKSSRFPGKPLVEIAGMTLLERTYRQVQRCQEVSQILIATDDERIATLARSFGAEAIMTSAACETGTDRIAEVVRNRPALLTASAIVNVQGDEPCIDPKTISRAISALLSNLEYSIGTVAVPITKEADVTNPNVVKCVVALDGRALYFSRSVIPGRKAGAAQKVPFLRHVGVYAFRPQFLTKFADLPPSPLQQEEDLEMLRALEHGYSIGVALIERHTPDVNTPQDIEEVRAWIANQSTCL